MGRTVDDENGVPVAIISAEGGVEIAKKLHNVVYQRPFYIDCRWLLFL